MPLHFKPYLLNQATYKGGKARDEDSKQKIYKLSSNENPIGASPLAIEALTKHAHTAFEYPEATNQEFHEALESFYNGKVRAEQFITTNSGVANIEMVMRGFLEPGTQFIYSSPAFIAYRGFGEKMGAEAVDVPLVGEHFELDVDGILEAINEKTRLILITSPNNPTGTHIPKSKIDGLINKLPDHVVLLFDEVYYQFADAEDYVRATPYIMDGKNVVAINSFSKAYGLAGLRVGYSYSTPEISGYLRNLRRPFMVNTLSMKAAMAALKDEAFINQTVKVVHEGREYLYEELARLGCQFWKTQANFILIKPEMSSTDFVGKMADEKVMVRPAEGMSDPRGVRVTIGDREANEAFIQAYMKVRD
ncbi:MAG: histidinol-phosphate transaminase [Cytophagales bacterium]|nr:histidinol-phosphate transaminase [Cytophagales bacterium]